MTSALSPLERSMNDLPQPQNRMLARDQEQTVQAIRAFLRDGQQDEDLYEAATGALYVYSIDRAGLPEGWFAHKVNTYLHPNLEIYGEKTGEEKALRLKIYRVLKDQELENQTWQQLCDKIDPLARALIHSAQNVPNRAQIEAQWQASTGLGVALVDRYTLQGAAEQVERQVNTAMGNLGQRGALHPATRTQVTQEMNQVRQDVNQEVRRLDEQINRNLNQLNGQGGRAGSSCCTIV